MRFNLLSTHRRAFSSGSYRLRTCSSRSMTTAGSFATNCEHSARASTKQTSLSLYQRWWTACLMPTMIVVRMRVACPTLKKQLTRRSYVRVASERLTASCFICERRAKDHWSTTSTCITCPCPLNIQPETTFGSRTHSMSKSSTLRRKKSSNGSSKQLQMKSAIESQNLPNLAQSHRLAWRWAASGMARALFSKMRRLALQPMSKSSSLAWSLSGSTLWLRASSIGSSAFARLFSPIKPSITTWARRIEARSLRYSREF